MYMLHVVSPCDIYKKASHPIHLAQIDMYIFGLAHLSLPMSFSSFFLSFSFSLKNSNTNINI